GRAVNDPVVARHRDAHQLPHDDLPVAHDGFGRHRADGEYGGLWRVDDRRELVYAEHAEVADGEGRARIFFGLEFSRASAPGQLAYLSRDLPDGLRLRAANDRSYQPILYRDCDADVRPSVIAYGLILKRRVDGRVLHERDGGDLYDKVVDAHLVLGVELV